MQHRALWGAEHSERAVESRDLLVSNATLLDGGLRAAFWCDNRPPLVTPSCRPVRAIEVGTTSCTIGSISSRDLEDAGMSPKKTGNDTTAGDRVVEMARRQSAEREKGYRAQALKLYPHICARCGREFGGKNLRELTVHHKDHDHDNNPPDGSNWELLCLYCHDNEHARYQIAEGGNAVAPGERSEPLSTHTPFAALRTLLKREP